MLKWMQTMKSIRENPPSSIDDFVKHDTYRILYDDIVENGTKLTWSDRHALADLTISIIERDRLIKCLEEQGESYDSQGDRHIIERKNPARTALEKLRSHILSLMREFKMTPNSRKMTTSGSSLPPDDEWGNI